MPLPRPPSKVDPLNFPVFAISWFGHPAAGNTDAGISVLAYCGGGGSAKTGVKNSLVVTVNDHLPTQLSTGQHVGVAVHVYQNPVTSCMWLVLGLADLVQRYAVLPDGTAELDATLAVGEAVNAVSVHVMADQLAVGCDSGVVKVYETSDDCFVPIDAASGEVIPLYVYQGHERTVCGLCFAPRGNILVSSAKDGTARVWEGVEPDQNVDNAGLRQVLSCDVHDPAQPNPKKLAVGQVLVRGCAVADLDGRHILTVASPRRGGNAYLASWVFNEKANKHVCERRTVCCPCPISAMSLSLDGDLLALGSVDGSVFLWSVQDWKLLKKFHEVHDLPVTCIAARPYATPLPGDDVDTAVQFHAKSCSADSKFASLTLQRKAARSKAGAPGGDASFWSVVWKLFTWLVRILQLVLVWCIVLSPIVNDARRKCGSVADLHKTWTGLHRCVMDEVLIAPASRPGIAVPPH